MANSAKHEGSVESLKGELKRLEDEMFELRSKKGKIEEVIQGMKVSHQSKVDDLDREIRERGGKIGELEAEVEKLGVKISNLEENKAALWTEAGNIFILTFTANHYWRLGKPGLVNCLQFVTGTVNIAVGLRTKKALIIDTESGAIRKRFSETEEIKEVEGRGEVVFVLTSRHLSLFSHKTEQIIHR